MRAAAGGSKDSRFSLMKAAHYLGPLPFVVDAMRGRLRAASGGRATGRTRVGGRARCGCVVYEHVPAETQPQILP